VGDSRAKLGPRLGRLHAWRDRGSIYVDGIRTSAQAAFLAAGVAQGADFTGTAWAITLGLGLFVTLEGAKIGLGALDYRLGTMQAHQQTMAEASPIVMRQLEALERLSPAFRYPSPPR